LPGISNGKISFSHKHEIICRFESVEKVETQPSQPSQLSQLSQQVISCTFLGYQFLHCNRIACFAPDSVRAFALIFKKLSSLQSEGVQDLVTI